MDENEIYVRFDLRDVLGDEIRLHINGVISKGLWDQFERSCAEMSVTPQQHIQQNLKRMIRVGSVGRISQNAENLRRLDYRTIDFYGKFAKYTLSGVLTTILGFVALDYLNSDSSFSQLSYFLLLVAGTIALLAWMGASLSKLIDQRGLDTNQILSLRLWLANKSELILIVSVIIYLFSLIIRIFQFIINNQGMIDRLSSQT